MPSRKSGGGGNGDGAGGGGSSTAAAAAAGSAAETGTVGVEQRGIKSSSTPPEAPPGPVRARLAAVSGEGGRGRLVVEPAPAASDGTRVNALLGTRALLSSKPVPTTSHASVSVKPTSGPEDESDCSLSARSSKSMSVDVPGSPSSAPLQTEEPDCSLSARSSESMSVEVPGSPSSAPLPTDEPDRSLSARSSESMSIETPGCPAPAPMPERVQSAADGRALLSGAAPAGAAADAASDAVGGGGGKAADAGRDGSGAGGGAGGGRETAGGGSETTGGGDDGADSEAAGGGEDASGSGGEAADGSSNGSGAGAGADASAGGTLLPVTGPTPSAAEAAATGAPSPDDAGVGACRDAALPPPPPPAGPTTPPDGGPAATAAGGGTGRAAAWTSSHSVRRAPQARSGNSSATSSRVRLTNTRPVMRSARRHPPTRAATAASNFAAITSVTAWATSASVDRAVSGGGAIPDGGRGDGEEEKIDGIRRRAAHMCPPRASAAPRPAPSGGWVDDGAQHGHTRRRSVGGGERVRPQG